jgi:hypothetical protein
MLKKHIGLVEKRILKGENIPHDEKMFSIFETYTEWIKKGKVQFFRSPLRAYKRK